VNQPGPHTNSQTDPQTSELQTAELQMVEMLAGMNATADMQVVQRTRRAVMQAAAELREQQRRTRRNMAVVVLTIAVLAMVLTPAIWSSVDDFLGGEQWFELPGMVMVLVLLLFSTIVAALIIGFKGQQQMHGRR
jgi:cytochrome bd-type quinol oxidase subunit 2